MAENSEHRAVFTLPPGKEHLPFTLLFAEEASKEVLANAGLSFSEVVEGLVGNSFAEKPETTGANPENADTTIG